ncbi:transporter substrate-binding domain-containing protein [Marinimicrobium sp. ABcell2]|uniref:transporter substrate-binding domain-containing protein n=1 Tax=Marinimicrobium sp. ABcell2 TaxID=3069751 RepID=UPI0027B47D2C|nr:transporter substrate-binding domain-containing protein [Marinimicrobium sp. ABcell2]MDQ2075809.1 transporter substrate-binding domain-containing protein [Marinimicrobium sp. ABcell2]
MLRTTFFTTLFALLVCLTHTTYAQEPAASQQPTPLVVGTREAPPFVIKDADGNFSGISIELWQRVATELELDYEFREASLAELIDGLQDGSLDVSVAALTVTASREEIIDFTHPFHTTGLTIAIQRQSGLVWSTLRQLFSWEFLAALSALAALLFVVGFIFWVAERRKNEAMFGGSPAEGIGASFWWAAVTMTTVGYGDKAPITFFGRVIALIWMFAAIILISGFTATIATTLTVSRLETDIRGLGDLGRARVATVRDSSSAELLRYRGIPFTSIDDLTEAMGALADDELDAVVYDRPILQYLAYQEYSDSVRVLSTTFERQDYAIALPEGSPLRRPLNLVILETIADPQWQNVLTSYLGEDEH